MNRIVSSIVLYRANDVQWKERWRVNVVYLYEWIRMRINAYYYSTTEVLDEKTINNNETLTKEIGVHKYKNAFRVCHFITHILSHKYFFTSV